MNDITLEEYWDQLNSHDWQYEFTDDHSVWLAGNVSREKLLSNRHKSIEHTKLYDKFHLWAFGKDSTILKPLKPTAAEDDFINS